MAAKKQEEETKTLQSVLKRYEMTVVVDSHASDDEVKKIHDRVKSILDQHGCKIIEVDDVGKRKLAYEIRGKQYGYYTVYQFDGSPETIAELETMFNIAEPVLRYLSVVLHKKLIAQRAETAAAAAPQADGKDQKNDKS